MAAEKTITGFSRGDDVTVRRTIPNIPAGATVVAAAFTVKSSTLLTDAQAEVRIVIPGAKGSIEDDGAGGTAIVRFDLDQDDTRALEANVAHHYDVEITLSNGKSSTTERGTITLEEEVGIGA